MAIIIPALIDTQFTALRNTLLSKDNAPTNVQSVNDLYPRGNRVADLLRLLTDLVDSFGLTATGGTAKSVQDTGAYTGADFLVGATVTFVGNMTAALVGKSAQVVKNTANELFFNAGAIPAAPVAGDTYSVAYTVVDADLVVLEGGKLKGDSQSNVYGSGPSLINAIIKLIRQTGGTVPSYLDLKTAEPFHIGSPHAGGSAGGHGGAVLLADALKTVRDSVAAYTKPT